MSKLSEIGEFGLIKKIADIVHAQNPHQVHDESPAKVIEGIGDDCAVLSMQDSTLLVSSDLFVQEIHFSPEFASWEDIGSKAASAAISDIAAMGGIPRFGLVSLACPQDTETQVIEDMYKGLASSFASYGANLVGGDTAKSDAGFSIDVTVIGEPKGQRILLRKGARNGDKLAVTNYLGLSPAGLHALRNGIEVPELVHAHLHPAARIEQGIWLAEQENVHAMIDVSDGLIQDAAHIASAASIGVDIDSKLVPIHPALAQYCSQNNLNALEMALTGGEDYELAIAVSPSQVQALQSAFEKQFKMNLHIVGTFTDTFKEARLDGKTIQAKGFNHFS